MRRRGQVVVAVSTPSEANLRASRRPHQQGYGYGFAVGQDPVPNYGHSGGAPGINGDLRIYPELGYVVIGLSNLDPPAASVLADFFTLRMPDQ
jgi:hypothetical protein